MQTWSRRRIETILLALLGIVAVIPFRVFTESRAWFLPEMVCLCLLFGLAVLLQTWGSRFRQSSIATTTCICCLCATPIAFAILARAFGSPIPFEMSALTTFGAASLSLALSDSTRRIWALSLVTSGFLVLFCAAISDAHNAVILPLLWMLILCLAPRCKSLGKAGPCDARVGGTHMVAATSHHHHGISCVDDWGVCNPRKNSLIEAVRVWIHAHQRWHCLV